MKTMLVVAVYGAVVFVNVRAALRLRQPKPPPGKTLLDEWFHRPM